jgi:phytanoyl-CoA hydroxylase
MLSDLQKRQFGQNGYVVVDDVISPPLIDGVLSTCDGIADALARDAVAGGAAPAEILRLPGRAKIVALTRLTGRGFGQYFDISLPPAGSIRPDTPINTAATVFSILVDEYLIDLVADITGPEITCNPTQHLRMKLPAEATPAGSDGLAATVPWHQDNGVLLEEADTSHVLTVWIPCTPATSQNGCLQVIARTPGLPLLAHCPKPEGYSIPESLIQETGQPVTLEMQPGSVLLMDQRTVHSSRENLTREDFRISLDLRYQPTGEPTGRPLFPAFIARSRSAPQTELRDPAVWAALWANARHRLAGPETGIQFFRWGEGGSLCA